MRPRLSSRSPDNLRPVRPALGSAVLLLVLGPAAATAPPAVSIQASVTAGPAPLHVVLAATGDAAAYHWEFGDGGSGDGKTAEHDYGSGRFTATLTATSASGETSTAQVVITSYGVGLDVARNPVTRRYGRPGRGAAAEPPLRRARLPGLRRAPARRRLCVPEGAGPAAHGCGRPGLLEAPQFAVHSDPALRAARRPPRGEQGTAGALRRPRRPRRTDRSRLDRRNRGLLHPRRAIRDLPEGGRLRLQPARDALRPDVLHGRLCDPRKPVRPAVPCEPRVRPRADVARQPSLRDESVRRDGLRVLVPSSRRSSLPGAAAAAIRSRTKTSRPSCGPPSSRGRRGRSSAPGPISLTIWSMRCPAGAFTYRRSTSPGGRRSSSRRARDRAPATSCASSASARPGAVSS